MTQPISRRSFFKAALHTSGMLALSTMCSTVYSRYAEPHWLAVEHIAVQIPELPAALDGLTIAHLTDLHVCDQASAELAAEAVALANQQQPDLIVLTGDYVTSGQRWIYAAAQAVAPLRAPLGVYATLGNHDYWSRAPERIVRELRAQGITVLQNAHTRINVGNATLWLLGLDSVMERKHDFARALDGVGGEGFRLLLAHEPDVVDQAAQHGIHLQLSGHSHGGQVCIPGFGPVALPPHGRRYPRGLQRARSGDTQVYTNRGVGTVAVPVRFNCRPEVSILQLRG